MAGGDPSVFVCISASKNGLRRIRSRPSPKRTIPNGQSWDRTISGDVS